MTIETCYQKLGGDYQDTLARIPAEALIRRFLGAFLKDPSFDQLCCAMDAGDRPSAFRAAHTLKGVAGNMGLTPLYNAVCELVEPLRLRERRDDYKALFQNIEEEFRKVEALRTALEE